MIEVQGAKIKEKFKERYEKITDFEKFMEISLKQIRRSIRVNTLKITLPKLKKKIGEWELTQVPWCKEGFWIKHKSEDRWDIGNLREHALGYFYVQGAASMIPPLVLQPEPGDVVLDMAAAPGSKATQIAQLMKNEGVLIANDVKGARLAPLGINMQRMGITNNVLTIGQGRYFRGFEFDKILLDAPCSGTGTIAKSYKTLQMWNPNMVKRLAGTQKQLLKTAFANLKEGGTVVYSTCSIDPEENENVISVFLEDHDNAKLESFKLDGLKTSKPITEFEGKTYHPEIKKTLRLWPQDNNTIGFFVAKIRKD